MRCAILILSLFLSFQCVAQDIEDDNEDEYEIAVAPRPALENDLTTAFDNQEAKTEPLNEEVYYKKGKCKKCSINDYSPLLFICGGLYAAFKLKNNNYE